MDGIKTEILADNSETTINSHQIEILKKHFPQCFDKNGNFIAEKLNEIVADSGTAFSKESYGLNWLGKSYARLLANENPLTLLAEDKVHNQKPENKASQNLLIKGDNLEVLKHLKGAYSESIKMIYIDPPYNTGSDGFVYQDDRKFTPNQLAELAGIETEEAKRILEFTQSKANSHSAWLTFMYPRLYIARELLKDDGVIFISIDDNEVTQLKLLCDEVFGEANFLSQIIVQSNKRGQTYKEIAKCHEYILVYYKSENSYLNELEKDTGKLPYEDAFGSYDLWELRNRNPKFGRHNRPNLYYPIYVNKDSLSEDGLAEVSLQKTSKFCIEVLPMNSEGFDSCWRWGKEKLKKDGIESNPVSVFAKQKRDGGWNIYEKSRKNTTKAKSIWTETKFINEQGTVESGSIGMSGILEFPKPLELMKQCIRLATNNNDIVLDFFAGSGTTAHAVLDLNATEELQNTFITVQIPENCKKDSTALKNGYKTIFEITKARIEKAAEKIRAENTDYNGDLGFKIFKTLPVFEGYLDNIERLEGEQGELFDGSALSDEELEHLLTTWKVYDGIPLTQPLVETDLAGYIAFRHEKVLYLMHKGFKTKSLKMFLSKLDETSGDDQSFDVERVVLFGYNFDSKNQLEINEAVRQYQNRKEKTVSVVVRY